MIYFHKRPSGGVKRFFFINLMLIIICDIITDLYLRLSYALFVSTLNISWLKICNCRKYMSEFLGSVLFELYIFLSFDLFKCKINKVYLFIFYGSDRRLKNQSPDRVIFNLFIGKKLCFCNVGLISEFAKRNRLNVRRGVFHPFISSKVIRVIFNEKCLVWSLIKLLWSIYIFYRPSRVYFYTQTCYFALWSICFLLLP